MLTQDRQVAASVASSSSQGLEAQGLHNIRTIHWNLGAAQLVEHALRRGEGSLAPDGALVVRTGQFTGRSPKDKFVVRDPLTENTVHWGPVNQPMTPAHFEGLFKRMQAFWEGKEVYVQDVYVGADAELGMSVRVVSEYAWHSLFGRQLFIRSNPSESGTGTQQAPFNILFAPSFKADPAVDKTNSETCIAIDFTKRVVLICGTEYAGEMKKSAFTIMNFLLPGKGVFPMHCSANVGESGDTALFFGLSGTGKTTLSADPERGLIGDDEHGWSDHGVFNFEGGCYAKCIRLTRENEPQIWDAIRFGAILENVDMDEATRKIDFASDKYTENTRVAYPLEYISNAKFPSSGGHPKNVIFLTADAFGVLPPISKLTPEQAMYHFLSGYTAKVAGTERGLGKEPSATFSAGFGAPFLPRAAAVYAELLGEKLRRYKADCWLVNTGWAGGPYGVGERMKLKYTRAMLSAALSGKLKDVPVKPHPVFKVLVPESCPDVPSNLLDAREMWKDKAAYDKAAAHLAGLFNKNFQKFTEAGPEIAAAAPSA